MDDGPDREVGAVPLSVVGGGRDDGLRPVPAGPRLVLPVDWLPIALLAGDALIAASSVCVAYWLRTVGFTPAVRLQQFGPYLDRVPVVVVVCACALALNGQYRSWRGSRLGDQVFRLCSGIGLALLLLLSLGAVTHTIDGYSRYAITYAAVLSAVAMAVERVLLRTEETRLRQRGVGTERVLVVGAGDACELLVERMTMLPELGYTVCAVVDDGRVVQRPAELARLVQGLVMDTCILALPSARRDRLAELVRQCTEQRIGVEVPRYLERHRVRPGLIGWAEANDVAGAARVLDRTRYDVYYVENWSLAMDLRIVLLTATRFARHRQAN